MSSFAPQKQRYFRGAKGDYWTVISRAVLSGGYTPRGLK